MYYYSSHPWTLSPEQSGVSLVAGLDSPLERGTGLFDWNVGLDYWTGTLSTEIHLPRPTFQSHVQVENPVQ